MIGKAHPSTANDASGTLLGKPQRSLLDKSSGVMYKKSVFSRDELSIVRAEILALNQLQDECSSSIAQKRRGTMVSTSSSIFPVLQSGSLHRLVEASVGAPVELSLHVPVEIRVYEQQGAGMSWHVDDVIYDPPQIEVVWTLENNSDCQTLWKDQHDTVKSVETEPNSAILIAAGKAPHCVTSLKYGKRIILKLVYIQKGAQYRVDRHKNQFENSKSAKNKRKHRIKSKKR
ncbi:expressed unknown protein [Seminavis robusta]|uniref:Uncharacterized protein n=1 Tax=Seminavis robusta TaxID=568900 RepID=A0A9N8DKM2_9STRA|nr:expressed unknown protein [Seminavis robusta]|eukprot:Sro196_g083520.1 n/a (231) ;mRNA; f:49939-50631